ncbi:MAG: MFS transporter [Trueperaceae bacterium]
MRALFFAPASRRLLLTTALVYLVLGALQALYGPAFPWMGRRFGVDATGAGLTVSLHFAGALVASLAAAPALMRFGYRPVLPAGAASIVIGAGTIALAPAFAWVLTGALIGGLGFGLLSVAVNLRVARAFGDDAAPALNLLNALFGLGAVTGPLAVGLAGGSLVPAMIALVAAAGLSAVTTARLPEPVRPGTGGTASVPFGLAGLFVAMYVLYVSTEIGVGSWETVHLAPRLGERDAAFHTSLYWAALTVGRVLVTPISARLRPSTLVVWASALGLVFLLAAQVPALALFAYPLVGLSLAPIFPTGIAWLQRAFPRRSEAVASLVLAFAGLGPIVTSGAIGALVASFGTQWVPTALATIAAALLAVVLLLRRATVHLPPLASERERTGGR